ncbi:MULTISPECIES: hypothetical protein [unclassified Streptomyces]|uniref:Uncharacterized protein n=1 Tax=Streptomyces thermocoprophilus TaxID=78356 RepID=A0ABV5VBX5_9ACTN
MAVRPAAAPRPEGLGEDEIVLAVALHGAPALVALVPRFAPDAGLPGRGLLADAGRFPSGDTDDPVRLAGSDLSADAWADDRGPHDRASGWAHGHGAGGGCGGGWGQ